MNNKFLLIGAAIAVYLLRDQIEHALGIGTSAATTTTPATDTSSSTTPPATSSPAATTPAPAAGIWDLLLAAAQKEPDFIAAGTLDTHQWNTLYQSIRGVAGPDPATIGQGDGLRRITLDEYRAAMTAAGLSGIGAARRTAPANLISRSPQAFARKAWNY